MAGETKIPVGVVGVGYAGRYHAEKYAGSKKATLIGVADINRDRAMEVGQKLGVVSISDYRELFGRVRCVSVAVPTRLHYQVAREYMIRLEREDLESTAMLAKLAEASHLSEAEVRKRFESVA